MADVFISYASEDRDRARKLASALEARGWSVWWDRKIAVGQTFDQVIEHELDTAKSVVVLWSKDSISSEWVKNEAGVAGERGVLVPALIDNVKLPLEFRRKQAADLVGWDGDASHEGFQMLCASVAARDDITCVAPLPSTRPPKLRVRWNRYWTIGAIALVAVVLGFGAYWGLTVARQQLPTLSSPRATAPESVSKSSSLLIESDGAKATAKAGDARISNYNRADILILARESESGAGIGSLTPRGDTGDANSVIPLPPGWRLDTTLVPPGGCTLQPTHIYNDGSGGYTLSVMTVARNGPCPWLKGEYRFQLLINVGQYRGGSMGKILIE